MIDIQNNSYLVLLRPTTNRLQRALEISKTLPEDKASWKPLYHSNYAMILSDLTRDDEALQWIDIANKLSVEVHGGEHLNVANSLYHKGVLLQTLGRHAEAENFLKSAKTIREKILGHDKAKNSNGIWKS